VNGLIGRAGHECTKKEGPRPKHQKTLKKHFGLVKREWRKEYANTERGSVRIIKNQKKKSGKQDQKQSVGEGGRKHDERGRVTLGIGRGGPRPSPRWVC